MTEKIAGVFSLAIAAYFIVSGVSALMNVPAKLERIGLRALNEDGQAAFIIIYAGLMIGIGISALAIQLLSKAPLYPLTLLTIMMSSILAFRVYAGIRAGGFSQAQIVFTGVEIGEVAVGIVLLYLLLAAKR